MSRELLPPINDYVFKLIFGDKRNVDVLEDFLKSILNIPHDEYDSLTIIDPHLKPEEKGDKFGILDVKVNTKNGMVINVEIQVMDVPDMPQRVLFYISKMITEQISAGQDYDTIKNVISIIILVS